MSKIALITGGSRGIGAATALYLAEKGYNICINYKSNSDAAAQVLAKVKRYGVKGISVKADVSDETDVVRLFHEIDEKLGTITHLVNNVGVLFPQSRVEDLTALRINKPRARYPKFDADHPRIFSDPGHANNG